MNKYIYVLLIAATFQACSSKPATDASDTKPATSTVTFPEKIADGTIYEVNIRQHTAQGTINAFIKDLPRLKKLGIKTLWIMPAQPIGVKNRKLPLGSYYSISDYRKVNPEFGTDADFKNLVSETHALDMYVILDWVPNHTAWDHPWVTAHPEYYAHDVKGNIAHEADWDDIALLDHTHPAVRAAMIDEMKYWVTNFDIDGFRCDHAGHEIPLYFWEEARAAIDPVKNLFWLAEWEGARMHLEFDGTYAWGLLHLTDKFKKGEANANDVDKWINEDLKEYGQKPFRLTMITNHDENSWQGTEFERYGEGVKTFATFIFTAYGAPMLYSGQEVGLDKRLKFFSKDTINWSDPKQFQPFYKKLVSLHTENKALWAGQYGAMPVRINGPEDTFVYAFNRTKENNTVIGILNMSDKTQDFHLTDSGSAGSYNDYFSGERFEISTSKALKLSPWQYLIFVK